MSGRYDVKIAGQGFLLKPGSYRRSASVSNSSLPEGWQLWNQSDWRGGDGRRTWDGETGRQGDGGSRWWTGYGIDVGEAGRVRLGAALEVDYLSSEDGFAAMMTFEGRLYAVSASSGKIYSRDETGWGMEHDTGKVAMASLARHGDRLYAGSGSDGAVLSSDGATWSAAFQVEGASAVSCMASYGVWDPDARSTTPTLFLGCQIPGEEARVYRWDGATLAEAHRCRESRVEAMAVYGGKLYLATSETGDGIQGRLLCFDGRSVSGEWSEVTWISDNYVAGWAAFDNLLFCGSGTGGIVWAFDGERLSEVYSLSAPGVEYSEPVRALGAGGGRLYAGYRHPSQGTSLLCKLGASGWGLGDRETNPQPLTPNPQAGWFTPCVAGEGSAPRSMAFYGGYLYLDDQAAGSAALYRMDSSSFRSEGFLESSGFDAGLPGTAKLLRGLTLSHEPLAAGQKIEAQFTLDDASSFQHEERFDGLAGCDQELTTVDWRPADSLVRLEGMPSQGFAGKRRADTSVPHQARKLASLDPNSPPAAFLQEFDDAEYQGVAQVGEGEAITIVDVDGGYSHQLFQFDLAGLKLAGLHPRAVCYGRGSYLGNPEAGVLFRIWNRSTSTWDPIGSNTASAGDGEAASSIETVIADAGCYAAPSGLVYLSLRSQYPGSGSVPSLVAADLVELGALWGGSGEVVSQPLRLPVAGPVSAATLTLLSSETPGGTQIELFMSADGGGSWEGVESGVEHSFSNPGSNLRWKARLSSSDGLDTPWIDRLKVDYSTGRWLWLGRSDTEGAVSAGLTFENGTAARRVAFRIELSSSDPAGSPALTGIALEYAPQAEIKRRWEFDLRCEGIVSVPLQLPDGSIETRTGRELSESLWQARERGTTSFEDVDGGRYEVWFEELEERLNGADQSRGPQTAARCVLTEC